MDSKNILGIRVDKVNMSQALNLCLKWLKGGGKHTIFTPNIEFIMAAQENSEFKKVLNSSDLNIPDSARLGWAVNLIHEKNLFTRILKWPLFLLPGLFREELPVTTGADLFENLCILSNDQAFRVGLLGGGKGVADKTSECLRKKYPNIKISYIADGFKVNKGGKVLDEIPKISNLDILFVAFGKIKQENWISLNKDRVPAKIFIGVGGTFDFYTTIPRAPKLIRDLGFEWLFRFVIQPWRWSKVFILFSFTLKVLFSA